MAYEDLVSIISEARQLDIQHKSSTPIDCPNDGTTLKEGPDGKLFCSYDGWKYNGNRDTAY